MELKEYLKIITKNAWAILIFAAFGALIAFAISGRASATIQLEQLFFLPAQNVPSQQNSDYYSQERARNFTDTAVAILESPDFAMELTSPGSLSVRKVAPQVIRLTTSANDHQSAKSRLDESVAAFNSKMQELTSSPSYELKAVGSGPHRTFAQPTKKVATIFGALAGGVFALFVIGLKNYFRI